jgi:hypothetical protein
MWKIEPEEKCLQHTDLPQIKHSPMMLKLAVIMASTGAIFNL